MRLLNIGFLSLGLAATSFAADNQLTDAEKAGGWKLLFDGSATTGWITRGKKELTNWKAIGGSLTRDSGGGDAIYDAEQFENFSLSLDWKIADNILFTSKLELFAPFKTIDHIDIRSDNKLTMAVNKYITANVAVLLLNIAPFPKTQIKETIAIGFTYNVF